MSSQTTASPGAASTQRNTVSVLFAVAVAIGILYSCWSFFETDKFCAHYQRLTNTHSTGNANCTTTFERYISSPLEERWLQNIEAWQNDYCNAKKNELAGLKAAVKAVARLGPSSVATDESSQEELNKWLSRFEHTIACNGATTTRVTYIEPLVGALRHPLTLCTTEGDTKDQYLEKRDYLVLESEQGLPEEARPRNFYFDLGASMYHTGPGGASQKVFVEEYAKRGIVFDEMYLWEPKPRGNVFQNKFDKSLAYKYHYYNTFAETEPDSGLNPFNIVKKVAHARDFVMFKLDIDTANVEKVFAQRLEEDPELQSLIDEFFYEHHVNFPGMTPYWHGMFDRDVTLAQSYQMFYRMRKAGIRAHGWP